MNNYKELKVWQKAVDLATSVYELTKNFTSTEVYGIVSQMRRAAVSIPSNLAEGAGRGTNKDFSYFLNISLGSAFELETQLIISEKIGYITIEQLSEKINQINEIEKMIRGLQKSLSKS
jgi:four helix bundle protein